MIDLETILSALFSISPWFIVKILVLMAFLIYVAFAFVLIKQVWAMTEVVAGPLNLFLKLISLLLFFFSIAVAAFIVFVV